jgi:hypothetical protein
MTQSSQYADDPRIKDSAELWRRIHPMWVKREETRFRVTSQAFQNSEDGSPMSVDQAELSTPENSLKGHPDYSLVGFTAGFARGECNQKISPYPFPDNPAHTYVVGQKSSSVRKKIQSKLQMDC